MTNIILTTDSYKASHFLQYPPGAQSVFSYIEARRGGVYSQNVFFGLQMFLDTLVRNPVTEEQINLAESILTAHGEPFNRAGWQAIVDKYNGRLPLSIRAVAEGSVVPAGNALVTVENTDNDMPWLTSYIETALLRAVWYPTTVATQSWHIKRVIKKFLDETSENTETALPFKLHDFGARGVSSAESAAIGGASHLVNFMGTDTIEGLMAANEYYGAGIAGFSIPAAEHSTITSWGRENEIDAYRNMLKQFSGPGKIVAIVADSYDLDNAVRNIFGRKMKDEVIKQGGLVVIRPDSGDPVQVPVDTVVEVANKFGGKVNSKGYFVLPDYIRVIQGDGVNEKIITAILQKLKDLKFSAENIAFGMGGALLQQVNRDTCRFAMKASAIKINDVWKDVQKNPATDPSKASKAGRLALIHEDGVYDTVRLESNAWRNELKEVFRNGVMMNRTDFAAVRERAAAAL